MLTAANSRLIPSQYHLQPVSWQHRIHEWLAQSIGRPLDCSIRSTSSCTSALVK